MAGRCGIVRRMSTVTEIESAIAWLPRREAEEVREWLEDQQAMTPEFLASIQRGKADLASGRVIVGRPFLAAR